MYSFNDNACFKTLRHVEGYWILEFQLPYSFIKSIISHKMRSINMQPSVDSHAIMYKHYVKNTLTIYIM